MIWLTPAFSVYTCACRAFSSSQRPLAVLPGEVDDLHLRAQCDGARDVVARFVREQRDDVGIASPPRPALRARCRTVMASGRMAPGCGLTITALPVARLANIPG